MPLTRGLSSVPPIPAEIREAVRARLERDGVEALHAELARRDPASAERLKPRDRSRIARALEVVEATSRSLTKDSQVRWASGSWRRWTSSGMERGHDLSLGAPPIESCCRRRKSTLFST